MNVYPRIFALVCVSTGSVEYVNESYSKVSGMRKSLPDSLSDLFEVVRYDPNPQYTQQKNTENKEH